MGMCFHDARLMWNACSEGAAIDSVLTIGRQLLFLHPAEARVFVKARARRHPGADQLSSECYKFGAYAEAFLRECMGAGTVEAIDYSAYEGAKYVHDMNLPIPESMVGRFDVVFDGGSLEHIFDFPTAISNVMRLVKVGGRAFISTPANNLFGHGFYQFSPELMFRIFAPENGFELLRVQLVEAHYPGTELSRNPKVYEVTDPAFVHRRVGLVTKRPVTMMVEARKLEQKPLFQRSPLQSDYVAEWSDKSALPNQPTLRRKSWRARTFERIEALPAPLRNRLLGKLQLWQYSLSNRRFFRKVTDLQI